MRRVIRTELAKIPVFDNQTWVAEHLSRIDCKSPNATYAYIANSTHPYHGCAFNVAVFEPQIRGMETLELLAKFADAVTVACWNVLSKRQEPVDDLHRCNITTIGGLALIVLKTTDAIQAFYLQQLRQIYKARNKKCAF